MNHLVIVNGAILDNSPSVYIWRVAPLSFPYLFFNQIQVLLLFEIAIFGYVADRMSSRQVPFIVGLAALGISTSLICIGSSRGILIARKVLQGASAAVIGSVGLALIDDTFDKKEIGHAMEYIGISTSLGMLLAPLLGGLVHAKGGYHQIFAMAFGLIAVDVVLRLAIIQRAVVVTPEGPDVGSDTIAQADIPLGNLEDSIIPAAAAPSQSIQLVPMARESGVMPRPRTQSTMRILLTSLRFITALWDTVVQAILLTAFDSVSSIVHTRGSN